MEESARELRELIQRHRSNKTIPGRNYPDGLRAAVLAHTVERRGVGDGIHAIAQSLGLNPNTLYGWLRAGAAPAAGFRKVRVASVPRERPSSAPSAPILVTPQGFRIEGLDVSGLVAVLRSLA